MYPDKSAVQEAKTKQRRKSFDITVLREFKRDHQKTPPKKKLKDNIAKLLVEINHEMGMNATEEDSEGDLESLDTIKRLQQNLKQPLPPATKDPTTTKGGTATKGAPTEENEMAGVKNLCMLCLERKSDAVIMDCGHSKICFFCAFKMYRTQHLCHLCRQEITKVIKIKRTHGLSYQKVIGIL